MVSVVAVGEVVVPAVVLAPDGDDVPLGVVEVLVVLVRSGVVALAVSVRAVVVDPVPVPPVVVPLESVPLPVIGAVVVAPLVDRSGLEPPLAVVAVPAFPVVVRAPVVVSRVVAVAVVSDAVAVRTVVVPAAVRAGIVRRALGRRAPDAVPRRTVWAGTLSGVPAGTLTGATPAAAAELPALIP